MNVYYYRTSSGREPVREYIQGLPVEDRVSIADEGSQRGDVELAYKRMKEML